MREMTCKKDALHGCHSTLNTTSSVKNSKSVSKRGTPGFRNKKTVCVSDIMHFREHSGDDWSGHRTKNEVMVRDPDGEK